MEFDSFVRPVWQLPIHASERTGNAYIHASAKYHCFVDGGSLCRHYAQCTSDYDDGITVESGVILQIPQIACMKCRERWLRQYLPEEWAQREEGQDGSNR